ncbi:hypothetical protein VNI00_001888 [Paramarasmius palmivorus]|uniref:Uncharacterized protein n=1 Tax=Paramarasmius palmivorus TaxID=297713 RepID=A0AAW0E6R8_9AGAR
MLKRQRPSSPSPASFPSPDPFSESIPNSKRQRVLPPTLDGKLRSREARRFVNDSDWEEDEEVYEDDDALGYTSSSSFLDDSAYKSTNNFLHELHTLQRHRLLFAQSQAPIPKADLVYLRSLPAQSPSSNTSPTSEWQKDHARAQNNVWSSDDSQTRTNAEEAGVNRTTHAGHAEDNSEGKFVKDRYEDTNRMLGSLFLSRRRELGDSEEA